MDFEYFKKRIGQTIYQLEPDAQDWQPITIKNEPHASWFPASIEKGYRYADRKPMNNVCIACES